MVATDAPQADDQQARLQQRMEQLDQETQISALSSVVLGGVVVVPMGVARETDRPSPGRARTVVMEVEPCLGFEPTDREVEKLSYVIESRDHRPGRLRFLEVKGRMAGAEAISVTRNEILYLPNKPDEFILAIVEFMGGKTHCVHYVRCPFRREPDFDVTSVNNHFAELLARAQDSG